MFIVSLEQVRSLDHFSLNASNFYISLTMVGAMGLIMLGAMWRMFKERQKTLSMAGTLPRDPADDNGGDRGGPSGHDEQRDHLAGEHELRGLS